MSKRIKSFKEYDDAYFSGTGGFSIGSLDSLKPMSDLGPTDTPPRNYGPGDNRGTVAVYANKKIKQKTKKEDLYSDDNPKDTIKGTGYGSAEKAKTTISKMKSVSKGRAMQTINTMYNRAKHHANQNQGMRNAMKVFKSWIDKNKIKESVLYKHMIDKKIIKE